MRQGLYVAMSAGRTAAAASLATVAIQPAAEESPGSMDPRWRLTAAGGDPRESATEIKPPFCFGSTARVKWCGKSAPRLWQQRWQGKPHREQDQIGAAGRAGNRGAESGSRPLPGLVARGDVRASPQMNGRRGGQPPDKTRLTGRLTFSSLRHACAATQLPAAACLSRLSLRNRITR